MKGYKNIFFDLDKTLWDFDKNAQETYREIFKKHRLRDLGIESFERFTARYLFHNDQLWALYREGKIEKGFLRTRRFELTLLDFDIDDIVLADKIGIDYITLSPLKTNLFPNTHEVLSYLQPKYPLHIITNGFEEVQFTKLKTCDLQKYFTHVITSEAAGCKKPDNCIFNYALETTQSSAAESVMIGDDLEVDIEGAEKAGMDGIFFNPAKEVHNGSVRHEIYDLKELITLF